MLWINVLLLLSRYIHVVCATLLVGGTLFYEMVVPIAIGDLKDEVQMAVFARARWVFRWVVWLSAVGIILSGLIGSWHQWDRYSRAEVPTVLEVGGRMHIAQPDVSLRPGWWWAAHASSGVLAALIAVALTAGRRVPENPLRWMRLDIVVLLVVIFLGAATRHTRLLLYERSLAQPPVPATIQPATQPPPTTAP